MSIAQFAIFAQGNSMYLDSLGTLQSQKIKAFSPSRPQWADKGSSSREGSQGGCRRALSTHCGNFGRHMQPWHQPFIFRLLHHQAKGIVLRTRLACEALTPSLIPHCGAPELGKTAAWLFPFSSAGLCFAGAEGKSSPECLPLALLLDFSFTCQ